jgi:hypothetical protein
MLHALPLPLPTLLALVLTLFGACSIFLSREADGEG